MAHMRQVRNTHRIMVGQPEEKTPLASHRCIHSLCSPFCNKSI